MKNGSYNDKPTTLLRRPDVQTRTGLSCSQIYKLMAMEEFPSSIPLYGRTVAWSSADIDEWINERIAEARKEGVM
jgi:prophage regulatory protein